MVRGNANHFLCPEGFGSGTVNTGHPPLKTGAGQRGRIGEW
jgi:hypothetical protein